MLAHAGDGGMFGWTIARRRGGRLGAGVFADLGRGRQPGLIAVGGPVVGDRLDGLLGAVSDGVDSGSVAGSGHRDVGELPAAAFGQDVSAVGRRALLAVHGEGVAVVEMLSVDGLAGQDHGAVVGGAQGQGLAAVVDVGDAGALAGDQASVVVGGEGDDLVANGVATAARRLEVFAREPAELSGGVAGRGG